MDIQFYLWMESFGYSIFRAEFLAKCHLFDGWTFVHIFRDKDQKTQHEFYFDAYAVL